MLVVSWEQRRTRRAAIRAALASETFVPPVEPTPEHVATPSLLVVSWQRGPTRGRLRAARAQLSHTNPDISLIGPAGRTFTAAAVATATVSGVDSAAAAPGAPTASLLVVSWRRGPKRGALRAARRLLTQHTNPDAGELPYPDATAITVVRWARGPTRGRLRAARRQALRPPGAAVGAAIVSRTFTVAAVATATVLSKDIERRTFAVTAVATATVLSKDIERRTFGATAVATATFTGINAGAGVSGRTFAVAAVATAAAVSKDIERRSFAVTAVATATALAKDIERRSFTAIGVARATFSGINAGAGPAPRTFTVQAVATATFLPRPRQGRRFTTAAVAVATVHGVDATLVAYTAWIEATYQYPNQSATHRTGPAAASHRAPQMTFTKRAPSLVATYRSEVEDTTYTYGSEG